METKCSLERIRYLLKTFLKQLPAKTMTHVQTRVAIQLSCKVNNEMKNTNATIQ